MTEAFVAVAEEAEVVVVVAEVAAEEWVALEEDPVVMEAVRETGGMSTQNVY